MSDDYTRAMRRWRISLNAKFKGRDRYKAKGRFLDYLPIKIGKWRYRPASTRRPAPSDTGFGSAYEPTPRRKERS